MTKRCIACPFYLVVLLVPACAFDALVSIGGERTLGGSAYVVCSYVSLPNEEVPSFYIWRLPFREESTHEYYYNISKSGDTQQGRSYNTRLSIFVNKTGTPGVGSATMTASMKITGLVCADEDRYGCTFAYIFQGYSERFYKTSSRLGLRAKPKSPRLTLETKSVHSLTTHWWVYETTKVTAKCSGNVGRPGYGIIEWRVYRENMPEYIAGHDKRVAAVQRAPLLPDDDSCTQRLEQTFSIKVFRNDKDLTIACFLHNADFPRTKESVHCLNSSIDMCSQSPEICVILEHNEDDNYRMLLTYLMVLLAGLLTALLVTCKVWGLCSCKKPPPPPPPPPPQIIPPPVESSEMEGESIVETETIVNEDEEEDETETSVGNTSV